MASTSPQSSNGDINAVLKDTSNKLQEAVTSDWDYKVALVLITTLAFITRFWGIGHPNEVVFDEVHFGKVIKTHPHREQRHLSRTLYAGYWQFVTNADGSIDSLPHTTSKGPTSSMSILLSESSCLPLWAGSSDMMDTSTSTTSETPTSPTKFPTLHSVPSRRCLELLLCRPSS